MRELRGWKSLMLLFLGAFVLAGCGTVPVKRIGSEEGRVEFAPGPVEGFSNRQELTSVTEVAWKLDVKDGAAIERSRRTGLKIIVTYEVVERKDDQARFRVSLEKAEVLKSGKFIPAPFMQFSPPNPLFFSVDFDSGSVDFSALEGAYEGWVRGLKETAVWDVMGSSFDVKSYVDQLEDLLSDPVVSFAGKEKILGDETVERTTFYLPFLGPSISVGPVEVEQREGLRGVMSVSGRDIAIIEGEFSSDELTADSEVVSDRLDLFGYPMPEYFESKGEIAGKFRAKVDKDSGWIIETTRKFRSVILVNFESGTLREDVSGKKTVLEL